MRSIAVGFMCLAAVGCGGEEESVSGVFPSSAFIGRTVRVQVSGDNTNWDGGTRLDFGSGITVSQITVASPTSLIADVAISDSTPPGPHDVVVSGSGDELVLAGAFEVASPIAANFQGGLAQGSVVLFTVNNFDFFTPFDDTCTVAGFFGCEEYGNLVVEGPPGSLVFVSSVSPYAVTGTMYLDLDAAPGPFTVRSGDPSATVTVSPLGEDLPIEARMAVPLTNNMATTTVAVANESHLYEVDVAASTFYRASTSTSGEPPTLFLLPASGKFEDTLAADTALEAVVTNPGKHYIVAANLSGEAGFSYTLRANPLALTAGAETGANETRQTAATVSATALVTGGTLSSATDEDWYKFTVPANSATRTVRALTMPGDQYTDTHLEIYFDNNTTPARAAADNAYHEDITSPVLGSTTTVYVRVFASPMFDATESNYQAVILLN